LTRICADFGKKGEDFQEKAVFFSGLRKMGFGGGVAVLKGDI
jgi:hypothetical protein